MNQNYINTPTHTDFYKTGHIFQYPKKTELIYSTWTPRTTRFKNIDYVVNYGLQGFIKEYLIKQWNDTFFKIPKELAVKNYYRVIKHCLGIQSPNIEHLEKLHDLGYLPIKIQAVKEGTITPIRVPVLTIENTLPEFFWVTNFLETLMSCQLWGATTSATIAFEFRKILEKYAKETNGDTSFVQFQGHDFSMRGLYGLEASCLSGGGHLLSFVGTDTIPAILYLEENYNTNIENELVGCSVQATEHSVAMAHGKDELKTYKYLIEEVYPEGIVSIVSDTWDFFGVLENVIKPLKDVIMNRNGKAVLRPDSGVPEDIICGNPNATNELERKGMIEVLWDIFGGTITEKGYKQLDSHIGGIYGDAITLERCETICRRLKEKGFASTNMVYGIGSYTYQCNTRDSLGFALKSTYAQIDGKEYMLEKDPKTDNGVKKSQKGIVAVINTDEGIKYVDNLNKEQKQYYQDNKLDLLEGVFIDGKLLRDEKLSDIRKRLLSHLE